MPETPLVPEPQPAVVGEPPVRRPGWRSPGALLAIGIVVLVLVVLGVGLALALALRGPAAGDGHVVSGPLSGRQEATLELLTGATSVTIRAEDLGDRLYRAATPDGSHLRPKVVDDDGRVQVHLVEEGPQGASAVEVQVNSRVRWTLRIIGGAKNEVIDLRGSRLAALEISGGVDRAEVFLPPARGSVPVRMSGGAGQLLLHAPAANPVQVRIGSGAGNVTVDGASHGGVSPGQVFTPPTWPAATDRYDVDAVAGVGTLTVDRL